MFKTQTGRITYRFLEIGVLGALYALSNDTAVVQTVVDFLTKIFPADFIGPVIVAALAAIAKLFRETTGIGR